MARSVAEINSFIVSNLVAQMATVGITIDPTQWSKFNIMRNMCYTVAICQAYMEQLQDVFTASLEAIYNKSAAASNLWIQAQMLVFQYSATNPQVLQFVNNVTGYAVIDPTLYIITACSVSVTISGQVIIKVATGNPFAALSGPQVAAAQAYANYKFTSGINYSVVSLDPDRMYIEATIWYQGLYSSTIQAAVIAAINAFFQDLFIEEFNGNIQMSDLEQAIRDVPGVNDVELFNVSARPATTGYGGGTSLILATAIISRLYVAQAGYCIAEDTTGHTPADSLTLIAQ